MCVIGRQMTAAKIKKGKEGKFTNKSSKVCLHANKIVTAIFKYEIE